MPELRITVTGPLNTAVKAMHLISQVFDVDQDAVDVEHRTLPHVVSVSAAAELPGDGTDQVIAPLLSSAGQNVQPESAEVSSMTKLAIRETEVGQAIEVKVEVSRDAVIRSVMAASSFRRIRPGSKQVPLRYGDIKGMILFSLHEAVYSGPHPILAQLDKEPPGSDGPARRLYDWVESELVRLRIFRETDQPGEQAQATGQ